MARILKISLLGNRVLRDIATPVKDFHSKQTQELIDDLFATLDDSNGVGLAAPQVFESKRVCIVSSSPSQRYPHAPLREPFEVINPEILENSSEIVKSWEGCLSVPGIRALVPRPDWIRVTYYNRLGEKKEEKLDGFVARVFLHEYDHLEGTIFLDKIESSKDIITEQEYLKLIKIK